MANNKSLNIRIPEAQYNSMKSLAESKGVSISDVAREIFNSVPTPLINIENVTINNNHFYSHNYDYRNDENCIDNVPYKVER